MRSPSVRIMLLGHEVRARGNESTESVQGQPAAQILRAWCCAIWWRLWHTAPRKCCERRLDGFDARAIGPATRTPVRIVAHLADLMTWAVTMARGTVAWKAEGGDDWNAEVERFFAGLNALDRELAGDGFAASSVEPLIQGPLADALTHVGQLALLRGLAGAPVRPESYARAEIVTGRVGQEQAPARREFDGDASARR